jgi:predicted AAA+ superfamily ATPase
MAHNRERHLSELFNKLMAFSPIVGIFGHRQVGKSTYIAGAVSDYRTLDDVEQLQRASSDPKKYIRGPHKGTVAIDECQIEPKLFPTLKEWVRTHKKPGQFILSGSVRFTSREAIRESLAGRIAMLEMLPFSIAEIENEPLSEAVLNLFSHKEFSENSLRCLNSLKKSQKIKRHFDLYLSNGGLPGLCFIRSPELRRNALNDLHNLILSRDLRLVSDLKTPISTLKKWIAYLAKNAFEPYNAAEVKRIFGLAPQTQKKLLFALESIFLIRRIAMPLRKKETFLLEDQFEESVYAGSNLDKIRSYESAVYRNIRTQFGYRLDKNLQFESYLTRDEARVPLVLLGDDQTLGIIVTMGEKPTLSETRSGASFLGKYVSAKMIYLSAQEVSPKILNERSMLCSIYSVL